MVQDRLLLPGHAHCRDLSSLTLLSLGTVFDFEIIGALDRAHKPLDML